MSLSDVIDTAVYIMEHRSILSSVIQRRCLWSSRLIATSTYARIFQHSKRRFGHAILALMYHMIYLTNTFSYSDLLRRLSAKSSGSEVAAGSQITNKKKSRFSAYLWPNVSYQTDPDYCMQLSRSRQNVPDWAHTSQGWDNWVSPDVHARNASWMDTPSDNLARLLEFALSKSTYLYIQLLPST